jgi:hypothetical protein
MNITEGRLRQIIREEIKRTILKENQTEMSVPVGKLMQAAKKAGHAGLADSLSQYDSTNILFLRGTNPQGAPGNVKAYWTPPGAPGSQFFNDISKEVIDQL